MNDHRGFSMHHEQDESGASKLVGTHEDDRCPQTTFRNTDAELANLQRWKSICAHIEYKVVASTAKSSNEEDDGADIMSWLTPVLIIGAACCVFAGIAIVFAMCCAMKESENAAGSIHTPGHGGQPDTTSSRPPPVIGETLYNSVYDPKPQPQSAVQPTRPSFNATQSSSGGVLTVGPPGMLTKCTTCNEPRPSFNVDDYFCKNCGTVYDGPRISKSAPAEGAGHGSDGSDLDL